MDPHPKSRMPLIIIILVMAAMASHKRRMHRSSLT
jgi:hypothetical protein